MFSGSYGAVQLLNIGFHHISLMDPSGFRDIMLSTTTLHYSSHYFSFMFRHAPVHLSAVISLRGAGKQSKRGVSGELA